MVQRTSARPQLGIPTNVSQCDGGVGFCFLKNSLLDTLASDLTLRCLSVLVCVCVCVCVCRRSGVGPARQGTRDLSDRYEFCPASHPIPPRRDLRIRALRNPNWESRREGRAAERARLKKPFSMHDMQLLQIIVPKPKDLRESRHTNDPSLPKSSCTTSSCCKRKAWLAPL
jgi:hypothetical protein